MEPGAGTAAPGQITRAHWVTATVLSTAVSAIAVLIGEHKFDIGPAAIALFPIVWAVLIGAIVGVQRWRPVSGATRSVAGVLLEISILLFLAKLGTEIGPTLAKFQNLGPAIVLQEVGHIFGTVVIALPVAVALGIGRASIGATWSIDRESYLAFAIERFGVRSPEYRGVFSVWLIGTVFGALYVSLLAGFTGSLGILSPLALALGLGLGSGSMMLGGVGALSLLYPEQAAEIAALAALSNLVTNIVGFYSGVFLALPLCRRLYAFWSRFFGRDDEGRRHRAQRTSAPAEQEVLAVAEDPKVRMTPWSRLLSYVIVGVAGLLVNALGTWSLAVEDAIGIAVLLVIVRVAIALGKLLPAIPSSVFVLGIGTLLSAGFLPTGAWLTDLLPNLEVMLIGLPGLALIGLTLGRDVQALRQLSWKIVLVALLTYTSSFLAAAALGQSVLHL
ncbi:Protein of unknown function [Saccharopolyspora kobensis]|uniref:DUF3100 family protein n=1 Tax=Saccharopolyspora kobensis TaxID=146035 RepID=A0A1H5T9T4_9PSEU|nr:DUF3100 domain-containing protein [Saccharopolyspora kobensis]SEF59556.1 Protein of unknown function [Saccharopolyspora kobensis]SFC48524.1 Protein of unknown function [Saccharopolyspora kobensis]